MKVIIAGSRTIRRHGLVRAAIVQSTWADQISEVVSGTAMGVDQMGEQWANEKGVPVRRFPADWAHFGKSAGYKRNEQMALYADALIAVWDGESRGTRHMIDLAQKHSLSVFVYYPPAPADDFDCLFPPRKRTARLPIFCELCRKQGRIVYRKDDDPRYGGGHYSGPTMKLATYLAGSPKVCSACDRKMLETIGVFD